jgi:hypothetical protein
MGEYALPFKDRVTVKTRPHNVLATEMPASIWPAHVGITTAGLTHDHEAEAPLEYYHLLKGANVVLVHDNEEYVITDCQKNQYIPHVAMRLNRASPAGA